jgi:hypothetical protein
MQNRNSNSRINTRTILSLQLPVNWLATAKEWASVNNFHYEMNAENGTYQFRRPMGLMNAAIAVHISPIDESRMQLETWLVIDPITSFTTLFTAPDELGIGSDEKGLFFDRKIARNLVNNLLDALHQPIIE